MTATDVGVAACDAADEEVDDDALEERVTALWRLVPTMRPSSAELSVIYRFTVTAKDRLEQLSPQRIDSLAEKRYDNGYRG